MRVFAAVFTAVLLTAPAAHATVGPDESKLQPDTIDVLHYIESTYPEVPEIGGWRPDRIADHPSGKALDVMVNDMELGDQIAADLRSKQDDLHIRYILWRAPQHFNHLHVCVD